jgi:hypothetical protein
VALLEKRGFLYNHSGDFPQVILIVPSHVPNSSNLFIIIYLRTMENHFSLLYFSELSQVRPFSFEQFKRQIQSETNFDEGFWIHNFLTRPHWRILNSKPPCLNHTTGEKKYEKKWKGN